MEPEPFGAINEKISKIDDVVNFGSGDPTFNTSPQIIKAAHHALLSGSTRYTPTQGIPELREAISSYYRKYDVCVDPDTEIIVTPGSQQALFLTLASTLNPGDEVLIPDPSYTVYSPIVKYLKAKPIFYALDKKTNFHVDHNSLKESVTSRTKIIIVCTPNNPRGTVYNKADLEIIRKVAIDNDLLVVSDEIYSEFIWDNNRHLSLASFPGMKERTVLLVSFSKTFSMTGWRLGYLIANKLLEKMMPQLQGNMIICPPAFVQKAGVSALNGSWDPVTKMADEYNLRINYMTKRLNDIDGVTCNKPEGAFYIWVDISQITQSCLEFTEALLDKKGVVTLAGVHFGINGEGYMRLAVVHDMDILIKGMDRIEDFINEYKKN
jgi:aspartate/methionine/tyrosine aminotransferase